MSGEVDVTFDRDSNELYIRIRPAVPVWGDSEVSETVGFAPNVRLDLSKSGRVLGIEIDGGRSA